MVKYGIIVMSEAKGLRDREEKDGKAATQCINV